jgi:exodeoxyribonuclease V alpha subunit
MGALQHTAETIDGNIERVTFHNPDNGFAVVKVAIRGQRELVTVVGHLAMAIEGESVEAVGQWIVDKNHGRQFKADSLRTTHPSSKEGIQKYLSSGLINGIGPHFAARLVDAFGTDVFEVIEKEPGRLSEVEGIGEVRRDRILAGWRDQHVVREIMVFLQGHGVGAARAVRIYKTYGDDAIGIVKQNPYRLAYDIRGIGFKTADQLAARIGIAKDSPLRARAGVSYTLQQLTNDGHCAYPEEGLADKAIDLLEIDEAVIQEAIEYEVGGGRLVRDQINGTACIYLNALYLAERELASRIGRLQQGPHPLPTIDIGKALAWVEQKVGLKLAEAQRDAVSLAARSKVLVITGGPGVGKTTIVNSILKIFQAKGLKCLLCAPTGRAAKRLSESTGNPASTIHRLLDFDPATHLFKRHADSPLEADLVLVDEASMLDLPLAYSLIAAAPDHASLVFVGDVDQLPSVGPGAVLGDLIDSGRIQTVRLTEVFRQAAESQIIRSAHEINQGRVPALRDSDPDRDFYFVDADEPESAVERIVHIVAERIPKRFGLNPISDIQVLTPMNRGVLGARNLNQVLQVALNPPSNGGPSVDRFGYTYRNGDKVLQTENDYDKKVFNGDLGTVSTINADDSELSVSFDGRMVIYDFGELDELMPAYAITIHKSQGSEYPAVVIPVHTQHYMMLKRNLLYTGITRGKQLVVLVGTPKAFAIAVQRADAFERCSALKTRLQANRDLREIQANAI